MMLILWRKKRKQIFLIILLNFTLATLQFIQQMEKKYQKRDHNCQTNAKKRHRCVSFCLNCVCLENWCPFFLSRSKGTFIIKLITRIFTTFSMSTVLISRKVSHWRGCSLHRVRLPLNKWKKGAAIKGFKVIFIHQTRFKLFSRCERSGNVDK